MTYQKGHIHNTFGSLLLSCFNFSFILLARTEQLFNTFHHVELLQHESEIFSAFVGMSNSTEIQPELSSDSGSLARVNQQLCSGKSSTQANINKKK